METAVGVAGRGGAPRPPPGLERVVAAEELRHDSSGGHRTIRRRLMRKIALGARTVTPGQGKVPASSWDLQPLAARVGNKDLNLSDWSYDFVRETLEAGQEVKKAWLYNEWCEVLEEKVER